MADTQAVSLTVASPSNILKTTPSDSSIDGLESSDGTIDTWNYATVQNNKRNLQVWIHDDSTSLPKSGQWTITLGSTGSAAAFDGWLDSDLGGFPAILPNGNTSKTVAVPGTSQGAITAGWYTTRSTWTDGSGITWILNGASDNAISTFSSIGPTADGRTKPDIAAPGQIITAALSSAASEASSYIVANNKYHLLEGTSMATPHVTGSSALLLGANPHITSAQIKNLFTSTATADAYATGLPNDTWGYGKLDVLEALSKSLWGTASVMRSVLSYDSSGNNSAFTLTGTGKIAVRFSPITSGRWTGILWYLSSSTNKSVTGNGQVVFEVYTNAGGTPGIKIGSSVNQPLNVLSQGTVNYIQALSANVNVTSGSDFFVLVSLSSPTDTIVVSTDQSKAGTHSFSSNNSNWSAQAYNFRIRPIITSTSGLSGIEDTISLKPRAFRLNQNFPNPCNPSTVIGYQLSAPGIVHLSVFDLLGREVAVLVNETKPAGIVSGAVECVGIRKRDVFLQTPIRCLQRNKKACSLKVRDDK